MSAIGRSSADWAISRLDSTGGSFHPCAARIRSTIADSLEPAAVEPLLGGRLGRPYRFEASCPSTQELLATDAPEGAVAATDLQAAGRGRLGRTWEAPSGSSLLCSILLRPPADGRPPELTLVAAVAVARAVGEMGAAAQIKWPNDVLAGGRKLAGVLGELREDAVVLGVGINVNQAAGELPPEARTPATSLRVETGTRHDRAVLLASLLVHLEAAYDTWRGAGLSALDGELASLDVLRGRTVEVGELRGTASGIDDLGRLLVDTAGATVAVESGEVRF